MKTSTKLLILVALLITASNLFATLRSVDPLILPQWHSSDPWNGRCPGTAGATVGDGHTFPTLDQRPDLGAGDHHRLHDTHRSVSQAEIARRVE